MIQTTTGQTVINKFPGYELVKDEKGKLHNMFHGEDVGFGGYVYSEPGMYGRTVVFDVQSMHPHSIVTMNVFGDYTPRYAAILEGRVALKHKDMDKAREIFKLISPEADKYLNDESMAKPLSNAMKLVLNMAYGYTSGSFENPMRDSRNVNNIVALKGALFMVSLRDEVKSRGFKVISIKTDSIKVVNPSKELEEFIFDFGKKYGYTFEIENIFEKICLVNDSTFIAKCAADDPDPSMQGKWLAKATQFQVPYVYKTLFSKEPLSFNDFCETKSVTRGAIYLDLNESLINTHVGSDEKFISLEAEADRMSNYIDRDKLPRGFNTKQELLEHAKQLKATIDKCHHMQFVGRVGRFCPVKPGSGGGRLYRVQDGKNYAVAGTTGYRWLEAEYIKGQGLDDCIDMSYFNRLVDEAAEAIGKYGDLEWFINGDVDELPPDFINEPVNEAEQALFYIPEGVDEEVPF